MFLLAAGAAVVAAGLALVLPDLGRQQRHAQREAGHLPVLGVLRDHQRVLLTLGTAVVVITGARALRASLLPLWADHIGLSASQTSVIFAAAALVDVLLFYPAGWVMDRHGRTWVALPVVLAVAAGALLLPLTSTSAGVAAVAVLMPVGNGMGAGIVMTLGADAAPTVGRAQFLGGWRLCGDVGATTGPLLVSAVTLVAPRRRMYETMVFWETADRQPDAPPHIQEYARDWQAAEKVVYSTTLKAVSSERTRIERTFDPEAVRALKTKAEADLTVDGPTLAAQVIKAGLVDEYHLFITTSVVGGGRGSSPTECASTSTSWSSVRSTVV